METTKYAAAVDLTCEKFGLPDFAYQAKVVSDSDKKIACELIHGIKDEITDIYANIAPGKNSVIIPFFECLKRSLRKEKASDMTVANRFFGFLSLLPIINSRRRPKLVVIDKRTKMVQTIPFALFEDLKEQISLMQYADGIRPYVLEWFYSVFMEAYNAKAEADSKIVKRGKEEVLLVERREAVTSQDLVEKTKQVSNKTYTKKNIVDHYVNPLINQGYVDSLESELDRRTHIYYPLINIEKNKKLGTWDSGAYLLDRSGKILTDFATFPDEYYVISKIREVLEYTNQNPQLRVKVLNELCEETTVEELAERYYKNPEDCFSFETPDSSNGIVAQYYSQLIARKIFAKPDGFDYFQNDNITNELQENEEITQNQDSPTSAHYNKKAPESHVPKYLFSHLIEIQNLPTIGQYYRCKEHTDIWDTSLKGIEESHFKPFHREKQTKVESDGNGCHKQE